MAADRVEEYRDVVIVRHSERLDEIDFVAWDKICVSDTTGRNKYSLINDPPITNNGELIAITAANTLKSTIIPDYLNRDENRYKKVVIFSSKLTRCYQTAYHIAQALELPIYVSKGLTLTAAAVLKAKGKFEYESMDSIRHYCNRIDCFDADDQTCEYYVDNSDWLLAVASIARHNGILPIVVAHRETIRNLMRKYFKLPYCCISLFKYHSIGSVKHSSNHFSVVDGNFSNAGIDTATKLTDDKKDKDNLDDVADYVLDDIRKFEENGIADEDEETTKFTAERILDCKGNDVKDFSKL